MRSPFPLVAVLFVLVAGIASPTFAVNLVTNPSFAGNTTGWDTGPTTTFDAANDATGLPGSGSAKNTFTAVASSTQLALNQCITAGPGAYTLGGKVLIPNGQAVGGAGLITVSFFSGPDCATGILNSASLSTSTTGSFQSLSGPVTAPAGTTHIWITGQNNASGAGTHVVNFDDFVLDNGVVGPSLAKAFGVASLPLGGTTALTFSLTNPNSATALTGIGFTDTLPSGLTVANGTSTVCGGTLTLSGKNTITLAGATLAASGICTFPVTVTGTTAGLKVNTTGPVTSTAGGPGNTASAMLTVVAPPTIAKAFGAGSVPFGGTTKLTFRLTNPNSGTALTGVGFTDSLPAGLVVATPNGLTGSCGGGTITATAGSSSISLASATLPAGGSCSFSVNVTVTSAGATTNTTGAVTSNESGTGGTASATVTVGAAQVPTLGTWGFLFVAVSLASIALRALRLRRTF